MTQDNPDGSRPPPPRPARSTTPSTAPLHHLRLLATTDLHAQLLSFDYATNRPQFGEGLAQTASLIAAARAESPAAILLDNGDFLQGSAMAEYAASGRRRRRAHPAIVAFNTLGYDAVALGNHEFNYGLARLRSALATARFPVLSANVALTLGETPARDRLLVQPYALIPRELLGSDGRRRRIMVGVLGLTPPQILDWDHGHLAGRVDVRPMDEAAQAWAQEMRRAGAQLVVCLAHTAIGNPAQDHPDEALATEIAALPGIDVVIAGHSHEVFPNGQPHPDPRVDAQRGRLAGKPAVQPGHSGSHLGIIDLALVPDAAGGWQVSAAQSRCQSTSETLAGLSPAAIRQNALPLRRALEADHRAVLGWTRLVIGHSRIALSTQFALAADVQAMRLVAAAKRDHVARMLQGRPEAELPILASVTPFRVGGRGGPLNFTDIPAGVLSVRHVFDLYPFPNAIAATLITGAQILARLELAANIFPQILPGQADQPLIDTTLSTFGFESIPGLTYRIDLSRPRGQPGRILDLRLDGRPLSPRARLVIATNSYQIGRLGPLAGETLLAAGPLVTTVLTDYLRAKGEIVAETAPGWSFAPVPGASVLLDAGAGGLEHQEEVAHLSPEALGISPEGFHRFRLRL